MICYNSRQDSSLAPSSSGLGHRVFIPKIAGSSPAGVTNSSLTVSKSSVIISTRMSSLHISISAEPVFDIGHFTLTNSTLISIVVSLLLIVFAFFIHKNLKLKGKISRLQLLVEIIIEGLHNLVENIAGSQKTRAFFPFIATFFFFIIISNWSGILPGAGSIGITRQIHGETTFVPLLRAPTADINTTLALGLISIVLAQYYGFKHLKLGYLKKFFNFTNPINTFVGILELISEFAKIISFAFRLFGNIFAGEVLLAVTGFLIPLLVPIPFLGLEVFVGFIQALVFAMLSVVFFNIATLSHSGENH